MSYESELELRVSKYLVEQREKEEGKRPELSWKVGQARDSGKLPVDDSFTEELEQIPLDWQIEIDENGAHFRRDFPYETPVYGVRGWDAARMVVDLDVVNKTVAMRAHFYDGAVDARIAEGLIAQDGEIISYQRDMVGYGELRSVFAEIHMETETTKGKNGCAFDQFKPGLDKLPSLVREYSGEGYDGFLANFLKRVDEGEIDLKTMPDLSLAWPLQLPYRLSS